IRSIAPRRVAREAFFLEGLSASVGYVDVGGEGWKASVTSEIGTCLASQRSAQVRRPLRYCFLDRTETSYSPCYVTPSVALMAAEAAEILSIDGHEVRITHPDKLYFSRA